MTDKIYEITKSLFNNLPDLGGSVSASLTEADVDGETLKHSS